MARIGVKIQPNYKESSVSFLFKSIVIRAIKDYIYPSQKKEIQDWVINMDGTFEACAEYMNISVFELRNMMIDKMIEIDTFGTARLYTNGDARMRL